MSHSVQVFDSDSFGELHGALAAKAAGGQPTAFLGEYEVSVRRVPCVLCTCGRVLLPCASTLRMMFRYDPMQSQVVRRQ